eukprot:8686407-Pyramimonas_sp.AAC.1
MTVLMHDAKADVQNEGFQPTDGFQVGELIYAGDTVLVGSTADFVGALMQAIQGRGKNYGLAFNWDKMEALPVRCETDIRRPDGAQIPEKDSIVYLGGLLDSSGSSGAELSRRNGMAYSDLYALCKTGCLCKAGCNI